MQQRYLMIRGEDGAVNTRPLTRDQALRIGRSTSADIRLDHEHISRLHARLSAGPDDSWLIEDMGSRNGTWIDGRAISQPTTLRDRHVIQLGPFDLWVQPEAQLTASMTADHTFQRRLTSVHDEAHSIVRPASPAVAGIDLSVLDRLNALSLALAETELPGRRMAMICEFIRSQSTLVRYCAVLGIRGDEPDSVQVLQASSADPSERPYISRTLLRHVLTDQSPLLLSTRATVDSNQPMLSIVEDRGLSAFACPMLDERGGPLLYVLFAAESCDAYWQSLLQLIVSHYRHADAMQRLVDQARIDRELSNARGIQLGLIPTELGDLPMDVAIGFRPCYAVGGDYADVIALPDGRLLIALADVSGKGMPAAMLSSSLHTLVHTVADAGGGLVQIAERLNRYLIRFAPDGAFATGVLLTIDPSTGELELINAGHMPPLLAGPDQAVTEIIQDHFLPLGILDQDFQSTTTQLRPGDRVVLYSDGLSELGTPDDQMPGTEGVLEAVAQHPADTSADTVTGIEQWARELAGDTPQNDDQTLVVVRLL